MKFGILFGLVFINMGMMCSLLFLRLMFSKLVIYRGMYFDLDMDIVLVDIKSIIYVDDVIFCLVLWRFWLGSFIFVIFFFLFCKVILILKVYFELYLVYNRYMLFLMFFFFSFGVGGNCKGKKKFMLSFFLLF